MKKNDSTANGAGKHNKASEDAKLIRSQAESVENAKLRLSVDASEIKFKKTTFGFDPREVMAYIAQNNEMYINACKNYDQKISDYKAEIGLLGRERESLLGELEVERAEVDRLTAEIEQLKSRPVVQEPVKAEPLEIEEPEQVKVEEPEQVKAEETKRVGKEQQKTVIIQTDTKAIAELEAKNQELVDEIAELREENVYSKEAIRRLTETMADYEQVRQHSSDLEDKALRLSGDCAQKDELIQSLTKIKNDYGALQDEYDILLGKIDTLEKDGQKVQAQLAVKVQELTASSADNEQLRNTISEYDIRQSVLRSQLKKADDELAQLREESRQRLYENEERLSKLETEYSNNRIELNKQLQVHKYHVEQAQVMLDELKKQLEGVRESTVQLLP